MVVTHSYVSKRNFTVTLVVTDSFGATNRTESSVEIRNRPPIIVSTSPSANIVLSVSEARTFEVGVWDPDGDPLTFSWSIGGNKIASTIPSYRFVGQSIGTYLIRAVASDCSASVAFEWHVPRGAAPLGLLPPPAPSGPPPPIDVVPRPVIRTHPV